MWRYFIKPRAGKYAKGNGISSKSASKKVVHKTGEFLGNKIVDPAAKSKGDKIVKPKHVINENPRNVEEIIILEEKREEILNELRQVLQKRNIIKYLSFQFATKTMHRNKWFIKWPIYYLQKGKV